LIGKEVPSEVAPGVSYRLVWQLGEGGMSVVFYALRVSEQGEVPVVVKMLKPSFAAKAGPTAALVVKKEAIALGRLNERVPPTPFVVRYIDTGTYPIAYHGESVEVPWVVVEYVHGGGEGTTLSERVDTSMHATGAAFDVVRAAHAIECLSSGLAAVHEVGVIHRDLKPDNVLCCGFGDDEIFKLADFGVARPVGVATFAGTVVGTPGFVAPELATGDPRAIGAWSDIFSLATVTFFLLTGEEYFSARTPVEAITQAISSTRRSILDTKGLSPELREREASCRSIDAVIARATSSKIHERPQRADAFAASLLPWLRFESARTSVLVRRLQVLREHVGAVSKRRPPARSEGASSGLYAWQWTTMRGCLSGGPEGLLVPSSRDGRRAPDAPALAVRSVAWDGDGRAMAATNRGLAFWNGASWTLVPGDGLPDKSGIRFVQRTGAGRWVVGGDAAVLATYTTEGVTDVRHLANSPVAGFDRISGDLGDLAVLVGQSPGGPPTLCALTGKRWLKPLPLPDVAVLSSLARVSDAQWLIAGRAADGRGFTALYAPLDWEVTRLQGPTVRAYLACAGQSEREIGISTGADGAIVLRQGHEITHESIEGGWDLSATAVDAVGRCWAASAGRIWLRQEAPPLREAGITWDSIWEDSTWTMPIVSLFADLGGIGAMTADGGVIEGRAMRMTLIGDD
jgi:serine/threonine protein kinase